jgi:hypothetical protein
MTDTFPRSETESCQSSNGFLNRQHEVNAETVCRSECRGPSSESRCPQCVYDSQDRAVKAEYTEAAKQTDYTRRWTIREHDRHHREIFESGEVFVES